MLVAQLLLLLLLLLLSLIEETPAPAGGGCGAAGPAVAVVNRAGAGFAALLVVHFLYPNASPKPNLN